MTQPRAIFARRSNADEELQILKFFFAREREEAQRPQSGVLGHSIAEKLTIQLLVVRDNSVPRKLFSDKLLRR